MSKHNSNVDNGGKVLSVGSIILHTTIKKKWLSLGIITTVCGAVITATLSTACTWKNSRYIGSRMSGSFTSYISLYGI